MSLMSKSLRAHASRLEKSAGECVTYTRGADEISNITAVRGESQFDEFPSEMEARIQSKSLDWLIRPSLLSLNGSVVTPERGDLITTADGSKYEVMPGPDQETWQYAGQHETFFRIHTVKR